MPVVLTERHDSVLHIRLNRPEVRNAINRAMADEVARAIVGLEHDDRLRAAVIDGAEGAFSSGMDFAAFLAGERPNSNERGLLGFGRVTPAKPLIAAVEGFAVGAGFEAVLACDLVVAAESTFVALPETPRGMIAGGGGLIRLSHRLPAAIAAELVLTGRRMTAHEAATWGLVNHVTPDGAALGTALQLAATVASAPPVACSAAREVLRNSRHLDTTTAYQRQLPLLERVLASGEAHRGARAFLDRDSPTPTGAAES
ncbi:enoyl-CoA hydratase [Nocardioides marinisabuli]|uniref:Enoyl-CoA hydratase n=1 Tax=Nocardioides marinisabuli TaxID=419476 RepID=A0A7Y9JRX5_9ACTN|nr:crotonase/enoyl-CoA hydratase family protein [Nocardioides marinisabuli]NYD57174.1 enoyl-CoA hydratase [Nocardioides marinisabuli]